MRFAIMLLLMCVACLSIRADDSFDLQPVDDEPLAARIARERAATVEDGYRLFLMLARDQQRVDADLDVESMTFGELREHLTALRLISSRWNYGPEECLRRDVVAYMSASYLGIRPGLLTGMFGMTRRYAHREMQFRNVVVAGSPKSVVSGSELLSVLTRISICTEPHQTVTLDDNEIH